VVPELSYKGCLEAIAAFSFHLELSEATTPEDQMEASTLNINELVEIVNRTALFGAELGT
jgi:hypothetical protein